MRIFIALDIPAAIRARMVEFMERARPYAADARWARPEGLHVTLKFVGEVKEDKLERIKSALATVKAAPFPVTFAEAGFFPNSKAPRVFWLGVAAGEALAQVAAAVDRATHSAGVAKEERAFSPHLTLARAGSAPGARHQLKPLASFVATAPVPQFGTMTAEEFWLYQSQPQRGGSKYMKLQRFALADQMLP
jgi:RNA 2',3'-cyclic 3'-phosphodiesterase